MIEQDYMDDLKISEEIINDLKDYINDLKDYIDVLKDYIKDIKKIYKEGFDAVIEEMNKSCQNSMNALSNAAFKVIDEQRAEIEQLTR
jgi:cysteinyl-tRNA synthetase